jgi:hypothetical protein
MSEISFTTTATEQDLIQQIADRASAMALTAKAGYPRVEAAMDITAAHANGCRLKLEELLGAEPFDFAHDVFGIRRHLNRETGELEDCFMPRYAVR